MPKRTSGIENKVLNSRESETKEPSRKNLKRCAFTLAEVLITLAIIGVVAALTIPVIVAKYQQKALYTQFMKTYNTLVNAIDLAQADFGEVNSWSIGNEDDDDYTTKTFDTYFAPYLKISKKCPEEESGFGGCLAQEISPLGSDEKFSSSAPFGGGEVVMLADGSVISFRFSGKTGEFSAEFFIDTNGAKGPNVLGRDIFYLLGFENNSIFAISYEESGGVDKDGNPSGNCSATLQSDENGMGCASRLLQEGKMDY